jgi:hypothetical protein
MATYDRNPALEDAIDRVRRSYQEQGFLPTSYYYRNTGQPMVNTSRPLVDANGNVVYNPPQTQAVAPATAGSGPNPFYTISNVKSQPIAAANADLLKIHGTTVADNQKTLQDYIKEFSGQTPEASRDLGAETAAIRNIFDPNGLKAETQGYIADYLRNAERGVRQSINDFGGRMSATGMLRGSGSYFAPMFTEFSADQKAKFAANAAQMNLGNAYNLTGVQSQNVGRNLAARQNYLNFLLGPNEARTRELAAMTGNLSGLSGVDLGNTFYGLANPNAPSGGNMGNPWAGYNPNASLNAGAASAGSNQMPAWLAQLLASSGRTPTFSPNPTVPNQLGNYEEDYYTDSPGQPPMSGWQFARDYIKDYFAGQPTPLQYDLPIHAGAETYDRPLLGNGQPDPLYYPYYAQNQGIDSSLYQ